MIFDMLKLRVRHKSYFAQRFSTAWTGRTKTRACHNYYFLCCTCNTSSIILRLKDPSTLSRKIKGGPSLQVAHLPLALTQTRTKVWPLVLVLDWTWAYLGWVAVERCVAGA